MWTRQQCFRHYQNVSVPPSFCTTAWDSVMCWPPTEAGTVAKQPCPPLKGLDPSKYAYRSCLENGAWYSRHETGTGAGFTNYSSCLSKETKQLYETFKGANSTLDVKASKTILAGIGFSTHIISVVALTVSLVLIGRCLSQRTNRRRVLIPLFLSAMMESITSLVYASILKIDDVAGEVITCQLMTFLIRFSGVAFYSWFMVLSLNYVFRAFHWIIKQDHVLIMYLTGFGFPVCFTPIWFATTKYLMLNSKLCQFENTLVTRWITDVPKFACILVAMVMFTVALVVVLKRRSISTPNMHYDCKKAIRLWCICGLVLALYIASVEVFVAITAESNLFKSGEVALYVKVVMKNCRGLILAVLICFLDKEVCTCCRQQDNEL